MRFFLAQNVRKTAYMAYTAGATDNLDRKFCTF